MNVTKQALLTYMALIRSLEEEGVTELNVAQLRTAVERQLQLQFDEPPLICTRR